MAGIGDFMGIMTKVKELQKNMQQMQEEMQNKSFEAASGGGMVTATVNGKGQLLSLKIDAQAVDPNDIEMLEDLVVAAVSAAINKSSEEMKQQISQMTGGLNIPGIEGLGKMMGLG